MNIFNIYIIRNIDIFKNNKVKNNLTTLHILSIIIVLLNILDYTSEYIFIIKIIMFSLNLILFIYFNYKSKKFNINEIYDNSNNMEMSIIN